ncbi:molybdenum cofactor biosynthesis protein MoaE [Aliikangiella maris]|uniref:Molybdenum cofactor biosynthesis protein MoaE n=2 Tax=Aliikangiella maris TaxID=3162458 RepID=A0ABV2BP69_9GAMM
MIPDVSDIIISELPLDLAKLNQLIQQSQGENGAAVIFTGCVRTADEANGLTGMTLEHYPGMTESELLKILQQATQRWPLTQVKVAHRIGYLMPGDTIVFVGVCSLHRKQAFLAAQFIMDYLKQKATFWKKEHFGEKTRWVEAKSSDEEAASQW